MVGKPKTAEMHPGPGFRIRDDIERPDPETVAGLGAFETPAISDLMNRLYTMEPDDPQPHGPEHLRILGPACTVKVYPGDNLMVHKSLDIAQPGDVIVVDGQPLSADRRARRPGLDEGAPPRRRRLRRRRPDPRPAGDPSARRLPRVRARRDADRPAAPRPGRDQLPDRRRRHRRQPRATSSSAT